MKKSTCKRKEGEGGKICLLLFYLLAMPLAGERCVLDEGVQQKGGP